MKSKKHNKVVLTLIRKNILLLLFFPMVTFAQVGINTTAPKAALDVESTNNGVLIPRVQLIDRTDITTIINPNSGPLEVSTLVYNIAASGVFPDNVFEGFYYWNGVFWTAIEGNRNWKTSGNSIITSPLNPAVYGSSLIPDSENYIGTNNNDDFVVATNKIERMRVKSTSGNIGIGTPNPTELFNVYKNSDQNKSVIFGEARQQTATADWLNIGVKGYGNGSGSYGFGVGVLGMSDPNNTWNSTGVYAQLGTTNPTFSSSFTNNHALVANGNALGNSAMFVGGNVGIGLPLTTNPSNLLHINSATSGPVRIVDGTQADRRVLTSDVNGVATWQPVGIDNIQANLTAVTGISVSYTDTANFIQTGASITLPPGRYAVNVTMLLSTVPGAYTNSNEAFWVRSTFADNNLPNPSPSVYIVGSNLISGNLVPSTLYSLLTGMVVINNNTLSPRTFHYVAGRVVTNNSTRSIAFFGGNYWAENNIIAYRLN
jgi:hypothetical protein